MCRSSLWNVDARINRPVFFSLKFSASIQLSWPISVDLSFKSAYIGGVNIITWQEEEKRQWKMYREKHVGHLPADWHHRRMPNPKWKKKKKKKRRLVRFLLSFLLSSLLLFVECDRESSKFGESFLEGTSPGVFSKQKIWQPLIFSPQKFNEMSSFFFFFFFFFSGLERPNNPARILSNLIQT